MVLLSVSELSVKELVLACILKVVFNFFKNLLPSCLQKGVECMISVTCPEFVGFLLKHL